MRVCTQRGQENPEGARFCNACAAPLAAEAPAGVRKTVTVLFSGGVQRLATSRRCQRSTVPD